MSRLNLRLSDLSHTELKTIAEAYNMTISEVVRAGIMQVTSLHYPKALDKLENKKRASLDNK